MEEKPKLKVGHCVVIVLGILAGQLLFTHFAGAATAETTVTVVITEEVSSAAVTASVPCNEVNCPLEETQEVEVSWWQGVKNWFAGLWVF